MPDDKTKRGDPDRKPVSGEQAYELAAFAKKHRLTHAQATRILKDSGPSRAKADAAVERRVSR
jgi:hypothetical protein